MTFGIQTHVFVSALARRANLGGAFATIARKGDSERGDVLVKVVASRVQATLYGKAFRPGEEVVFTPLPEGAPAQTEAEVDAYIARRVKTDPDLWVVEIEDREGRHFLTMKVETG